MKQVSCEKLTEFWSLVLKASCLRSLLQDPKILFKKNLLSGGVYFSDEHQNRVGRDCSLADSRLLDGILK